MSSRAKKRNWPVERRIISSSTPVLGKDHKQYINRHNVSGVPELIQTLPNHIQLSDSSAAYVYIMTTRNNEDLSSSRSDEPTETKQHRPTSLLCAHQQHFFSSAFVSALFVTTHLRLRYPISIAGQRYCCRCYSSRKLLVFFFLFGIYFLLILFSHQSQY